MLPGAAERIMHAMEVQVVDASSRDDRITDAYIGEVRQGQRWAIILTLVCIVAAAVFFGMGNNVAGAIFLSPPVLFLVGSLIPRRQGAPRSSDDPAA